LAKSKIERDDALKIARKIGASVEKDGKHQLATLRYEGKIILVFGIRHGKKSGHGHLVGENHALKINGNKAVALAKCTLSCESYFDILRERGIIPEDEPEPI
jgi:hypothetical protein